MNQSIILGIVKLKSIKPQTTSAKSQPTKNNEMEIINLNNQKSFREFTFLNIDSYLRIKKITVVPGTDTAINWQEIIPNLFLKIELRYIVHQTNEFTDDRIIDYQINLTASPNQIHPIFEMDKYIRTQEFTLGSNPDKKYYTDLKITLVETESINESYSVQIEFERFKMDDKTLKDFKE